jgi:hypothetical protein
MDCAASNVAEFDLYKLLGNTVLPRLIALVITIDPQEPDNALQRLRPRGATGRTWHRRPRRSNPDSQHPRDRQFRRQSRRSEPGRGDSDLRDQLPGRGEMS